MACSSTSSSFKASNAGNTSTANNGSGGATTTGSSSPAGGVNGAIGGAGAGGIGGAGGAVGVVGGTTSTAVTIPQSDTRSAMATHFDGMGAPGGCGVTPALVDSQNYVALDVEYTPNNLTQMDTRPITNMSIIGEFNNGLNCGRWLTVTIGDFCTGSNGGSNATDFCTGGTWVSDELTGATLNMIVADSCQDPNGWCRVDRYHLDLNTPSLQQFVLNGSSVGTALSSKWNNRKIAWNYISAPGYSGDVNIYFVPQAQQYWPTIMITHLQNGIHKVERNINGAWTTVPNLTDEGQVFVMSTDAPPYTIRIYDVADQLINNGRVYQFNMPCTTSGCSDYTKLNYTTQ
jgi:hypothetical protein